VRSLGFGEVRHTAEGIANPNPNPSPNPNPNQVRHTAECIAACRRGAMECEPGRADPPLGSEEAGLSFLFHESGIGDDTADLVRKAL